MELRLYQSMADIKASQWDACAGQDHPFVSHSFLRLLEDSGSAGSETGWMPLHAMMHDEEDQVVACAPLYVKGHSWGEYVFDHSWAQAYQQTGQNYYPKLQCAVPFSPVSGPRLLIREDVEDKVVLRQQFAHALKQITDQFDVSSLHVTFCEANETTDMTAAGYLHRTGIQYHWQNNDYRDFDDFLATFRSAKRKTLKKERRAVRDAGVTFTLLTGSDLHAHHWDAFWPFYLSTVDKRWGSAYLTEDFFHELGKKMADHVLLILAEKNGEVIGGALNLLGKDTVYGRVWGCNVDVPFLHFEACYYQAIDFAIREGYRTVEAGAQGQHKLQRGYSPVLTHSCHWIPDPSFRSAVKNFLRMEQKEVDDTKEILTEHLPYRRT